MTARKQTKSERSAGRSTRKASDQASREAEINASANPAERVAATGRTRVARHRARAIAGGARRVEVTVPDEDAQLIKAVADALRDGGTTATAVRNALEPVLMRPRARTGAELVAFFRQSPIARHPGLTVERDQSTGRSIDLD